MPANCAPPAPVRLAVTRWPKVASTLADNIPLKLQAKDVMDVQVLTSIGPVILQEVQSKSSNSVSPVTFNEVNPGLLLQFKYVNAVNLDRQVIEVIPPDDITTSVVVGISAIKLNTGISPEW